MYDQGFKKVVHNADVLSWILRDCVGPFKGMEIGEIRKCLDIGENGRVRGLEQEFSSEENGPVIMDNVFLVRLPGSEGKIAVMVDVEGQSGSAGPARSMQRAVCYLSRMIESQKGRGDDPYRNILPVFGVWIDFNAPACEANTMVVYNGFPLPESDGPLSGMSLLNLVRVRIGRGEVAEGVNVMSLFGTMVSSGSGGADAVKILEDKFHIDRDESLADGVGDMSLGEEVYESGFEQGEISGFEKGEKSGAVKKSKELNVDYLAKLSKKYGLSLDELADTLDIPVEDRPELFAEVRSRTV